MAAATSCTHQLALDLIATFIILFQACLRQKWYGEGEDRSLSFAVYGHLISNVKLSCTNPSGLAARYGSWGYISRPESCTSQPHCFSYATLATASSRWRWHIARVRISFCQNIFLWSLSCLLVALWIDPKWLDVMRICRCSRHNLQLLWPLVSIYVRRSVLRISFNLESITYCLDSAELQSTMTPYLSKHYFQRLDIFLFWTPTVFVVITNSIHVGWLVQQENCNVFPASR